MKIINNCNTQTTLLICHNLIVDTTSGHIRKAHLLLTGTELAWANGGLQSSGPTVPEGTTRTPRGLWLCPPGGSTGSRGAISL